jgi:hypothetical protein
VPAVRSTARTPLRLFLFVLLIPWWKGLSADSEEKREPASDIDTALVNSLKALDPERPIREGLLFSIIALPSKRESGGRAISVPDYCQTQAIGEEAVERRRAETSTTADSASAGATRPRFL